MRLQKPGRFFGAFSLLSFLIVVALAFYGWFSHPDEKLLPLYLLYFIAFFIICGGFFMFSAIIVSGMDRISERIFKLMISLLKR
jgi:hypothetical protein